jgi:GNAT superfamily N-acetyltransferase
VDSSEVLGVSCWLPPQSPSQPESWYSWYQGWVLSWRQLLTNVRYFGHGGLITRRYWIWKARQQEAQQQIWNDPKGYYFCNIVAVRPDAQGKGIGRTLFEHVTKLADEEGIKCYLESSKNSPNVEIYNKMGFEMVKIMECKDEDDACMVWRLSFI